LQAALEAAGHGAALAAILSRLRAAGLGWLASAEAARAAEI
jgi:hypothetical protein